MKLHKYFLVPLLLSLYASYPFAQDNSYSDKIKKYQDEIQDKGKDLSRIKEKIEEYLKKKNNAIKQESGILTQLEKIEKRITSLDKEIRKYETFLNITKKQITMTSTELIKMGNLLNNLQKRLMYELCVLYKDNKADLTEFIIFSEKYNNFERKCNYVKLIANNDIVTKNATIKEKEIFTKNKNALEQRKKEYDKLYEETSRKIKSLINERVQQGKFLTKVREEKKLTQGILKELSEADAQLQNLIAKIQKEIGNIKELDKLFSEDFANLKGRLPWPVAGEVVSSYGKVKHPKFNAYIINNGIEISSAGGTAVKSVAAGIVIYADWFKGYGQLVILEHGGGYSSLYGHLGEVYVKPGDKVECGFTIGEVGTAGSFSGKGLYFEIRKASIAVNPVNWLKEAE